MYLIENLPFLSGGEPLSDALGQHAENFLSTAALTAR
jgi:hypothetical protein